MAVMPILSIMLAMAPISFVMIAITPTFFMVFFFLLAGSCHPLGPAILLGKFSVLDRLLELFTVLSQIGVRIMAVIPILSIMLAMAPISFVMVAITPTFFMVFFFLLTGSCHPFDPGILFRKFSVLDCLLQFCPDLS
jgi:hypothetical protein